MSATLEKSDASSTIPYSTNASPRSSSQGWTLPYYDGNAVEEYYNKNPGAVAARLARIGVPLGMWYLTTQVDKVTGGFGAVDPEAVSREAKAQGSSGQADRGSQLRRKRGEELRETLVSTGSVTFIKSGQAMALRPDLVKVPEYVSELEKLQDEVGTFPTQQALKIIEEDLGRPAEEVFEFVYPDPVASASIGQVFRCRVRATGEEVAVKVQRPDAFASAALDMYLLRNIARFVKQWKNLKSDMVGIADEFGKQLFGELDYIQEGQNCKRFKELYGNIEGIYVPDVVMELTTRRVLTMEWVEGDKGPWPEDGEKLLTVGLQCSVMQILDSGFFHADPHRGNLLRTPDGRLAYLDFGMMANVTDENRYSLIATTLGLQYKDLDLITRNLITLGFLPDETNADVLVPKLRQAFKDAAGGNSASKLNFTRLNENIQEISYLLPFRVPPFYSLIVRTLTILEGLALYVDPDFRLIRGAYPFIAKQVLTSNSKELKNLMQRVLITEDNKIYWARLEQLLSISRSTSSGNFQDLKKAQEMSDLRRTFGVEGAPKVKEDEEDDKAKVNIELAGEVLDFLVSENGGFLREPLINELVDTADSVGLAGLNMASIASGGLLPRSPYTPDRARLEVLGKLLVQALERQQVQSPLPQMAMSGGGPGLTMSPALGAGAGAGLPNLVGSAQSALQYLQNPDNQKQLEPIIRQGNGILVEVFARLLERNAARVAKEGLKVAVSPLTFNPLANLLDIVLPAVSSKKKR